MKKIAFLTLVAVTPLITRASGHEQILRNAYQLVVRPLIVFLFAVALVIFAGGIVGYIAGAESAERRKKGQRAILWGIVGMFIMVAVFGILQILAGTLQVENPTGDIIGLDQRVELSV